MSKLNSIQFTNKEGRSVGNIKIFALSTCGWCNKTKKFLDEHKVAYSFVDVDLLPEDKMEEVSDIQSTFNPRGSYPTIVIDEKETIVGFDKDALEKLLGA